MDAKCDWLKPLPNEGEIARWPIRAEKLSIVSLITRWAGCEIYLINDVIYDNVDGKNIRESKLFLERTFVEFLELNGNGIRVIKFN